MYASPVRPVVFGGSIEIFNLMTTKLNLAGKPFTNRALPWAVTTLLILVSLVVFVFIIRATGQANAQANAVQQDINNLSQQAQSLQKQVEAVRESLTLEQKQTLNAAHGLVDRKGFSWSRLLADLESALPGAVRVSRISVRDIAARRNQTFVELDLAVFSKSPATIIEMIGQMNKAGIFQAELRSQNLQKGRGESGTEYEIYVLYQPRAGASSADDQPASVASVENSAQVANGGPR